MVATMIGETFTADTLRSAIITATRKGKRVYLSGASLEHAGIPNESDELREWVQSIPNLSWRFWNPIREELVLCVDMHKHVLPLCERAADNEAG